MGSVSTIYNGVRRKIAGRALMDVAFSSTSTNGVQNKVIKAKFDAVDADLSNINTSISNRVLATATGNGVKTYAQIFNELVTQLISNIENRDYVRLAMVFLYSGETNIFKNDLYVYDTKKFRFSKSNCRSNAVEISSATLENNASTYYSWNGTQYYDLGATVCPNGGVFTIMSIG